MRTIFILISLSFFTNLDWMSETEVIINKLNSESKLKSLNKIDTDSLKLTTAKYKLKQYSKLEITISNGEIDTTNYQFYLDNDFVFASYEFYISPYYLQKGAPFPGRPKGNLLEEKIYFKNKNEGIKLRRTLEYIENNNIDSLKLVLQKNKFDTIFIGNDEYFRISGIYKRMNSNKLRRKLTKRISH